jgi:hypothetical protein
MFLINLFRNVLQAHPESLKLTLEPWGLATAWRYNMWIWCLILEL